MICCHAATGEARDGRERAGQEGRRHRVVGVDQLDDGAFKEREAKGGARGI